MKRPGSNSKKTNKKSGDVKEPGILYSDPTAPNSDPKPRDTFYQVDNIIEKVLFNVDSHVEDKELMSKTPQFATQTSAKYGEILSQINVVAPDDKKDDRFLERDAEPQAAFKDLTVPMEVVRKVKDPPIRHTQTHKNKIIRRMSKAGTHMLKAKLKIGDVDLNSSPKSSDNHNLVISSLSALHNIPTRKDLDDSPGLKAESPHGRRKSSILSLSFGATNALA